jgi:hypothetical protein
MQFKNFISGFELRILRKGPGGQRDDITLTGVREQGEGQLP